MIQNESITIRTKSCDHTYTAFIAIRNTRSNLSGATDVPIAIQKGAPTAKTCSTNR